MSVEGALTELVAACRDKLAAKDAEADIDRRRNAALTTLHKDEGVSRSKLLVMVRDRLRAEGFTEKDIDRLGLSYSNLINATGGRRS